MSKVSDLAYFPAWLNQPGEFNDKYDWVEICNDSTPIHLHFKTNEFWNPKAGLETQWLPQNLLDCIFAFREFYEKEIRITSCYRNYTPSGPGVFGAVNQSPHNCGVAVDFQPVNPDPYFQKTFEDWIRSPYGEGAYSDLYKVRFVGLYPTFVHVDVMDDPNKRPWPGLYVKNSGYIPPMTNQEVFDYDFVQPSSLRSPVVVWIIVLLILVYFLAKKMFKK